MPEAQIIYEDEKNKYFPLAAPFRYARNSFWMAGVDALTSPPGQNEDHFLKLDNILPVTKGTLEKRWGYKLFSSPAFAATRMVEYQSDATSIRRILLANNAKIASIKEDGTSDNTSVTTVSATPRIVVSRDWAYVIDNQHADLKKLGDATGNWQVENWGITGPQSATASEDETKYAGTVAQSALTAYNLNTSETWTTPTNAQGAPDSIYTTATWPASTFGLGWPLACTNYSFALSNTGPVGRVIVTVTGYWSAGLGDGKLRAYLMVGGSPVGSLQIGTLPTSAGTLVFNYSPSQWGVPSLTAAQVNASNFGVFLVPEANSAGTMYIDAVKIEVQTSGGTSPAIGTLGAGSIDLTVGRIYYFVYRNSSTGQISDLSQPSVSTGPLASKNVALSNLLASSDTQVDFVDILATADGGDETTLFYLDSVANGTTTYTDNTPETVLLLNNTYLETDQYGNEIGVAANTPPPTATTGIKHRGRIYLADGQFLYFSKSLGELTTSTGLIAGRYEECWPASYSLDISAGAETIRGLLSDGMILYIGTERHVRRLIGDGPLNFTKPDVTFAEVGVLNQEVWKVVYHEGMPTGVIWMTPDFRVIWSDFNTYRDISPAIQGNSLASGYLKDINQSASAAACRAEIFTSGPYDFYFLFIPTGVNTTADTVLVFNIKTQQWFRWYLADNVDAVLFNVTADGVPQLLFSADSNSVYRFGTGLSGITLETQDRVGNTPVNITATVQTSWLALGDLGMRKSLNNLEVTTDDTAMTVDIDGATSAADFTTPDSVLSGRALRTNIWNEYRLYPANKKARKRFYRYTFTSPSAITTVLSYFGQEIFPVHKF